MKADDEVSLSAVEDNARRAAVGLSLRSLRERHRVGSVETMLLDDPAAVAREVARDDDLAARFTRGATAVGMNVHPATLTDWLDVVGRLLQKHEVRLAAVPAAYDGFLGAKRVGQLRQRLAADGIMTKSDTNDEVLFSAGAAVTGVTAAIAEHGSLVCESQPAVARGSSLISPVHIAVVAAAQLLPDLCDYFDALGKRPEMPAAVSLITGPSKTADIEGVLVTGVHGPGAVEIVLVYDA